MPLWNRWADKLPGSLRSGLRRGAPYVLLEASGVAYCRIPKAANSTIRRLLAASLGIRGHQDPPVNTDTFWRGETARAAGGALLTPAEMAARRKDGLFVFTVVRDPFDRLKSCYEAKILDTTDGQRRPPLGSRFPGGMAFEAFVERVAATPDDVADPHVRSQASIIDIAVAGMPTAVLHLETIATGWDELRPRLAERGVDVPAWPPRRQRADVARLSESIWTEPLIEIVRKRYAEDFRLFYPAVETPRAIATADD